MAETFRFTSQRVKRLHERLQNEKTYVDIRRAKYFTESFRETEGEPIGLRYAKALYHIVENMDIDIEEDQLLAGQIGGPERYGVLYPEMDGCFLSGLKEVLDNRREASFQLREEDRQYLLEEVAPYWEGRSFYDSFAKSLPEDILKLTYDPADVKTSRYLVNDKVTMIGASQWVLDYEKGIKRGFLSIKEEALEKLAKLDGAQAADAGKKEFYQEIVLVADAIILFAERYSKKAAEKAEATQNPVRKAELLEISRICKKVPKLPAETFYEALQAQFFMQMFSRLEQKTGGTISNGRMDQYLYPYYKKDIQEGRIDDTKVKELFSCLWYGISQYRDMYVSPAGGSFSDGYAHWEAVTIGGVDRDGYDATNELSYLLLENKRDLPLDYPDLAARIHENTPERFLYEVAETIKMGSGHPKLLNDEEIIPVYLAKGATFAEANDYAVSGCTETRLVNRETLTTPGPAINIAAVVELTLRNGRMKQYGEELLTLETGTLDSLHTWEDFYAAFQKQADYYLRRGCRQLFIAHRLRAQHFATPLCSSLHDLCMEQGVDLHQPKVEGGIDLGFFDLVGFATTIDSLSAIRKNVFEKNYVTLEELLKVLDADFEGYEILRQRLLHSPSYGNNDSDVDLLARELDALAGRVAEEESRASGTNLKIDVRYVPVSANVAMGRVVSALPDGRRGGEALSDGTSAAQGADVNGPTAVLLSNYHAKNGGRANRAARLLNLKFTPACLEGEAGTVRLVQFIKSWRDLKLWHIQFNVINQETLLDAQKHPENYRNLIVRVAGYSAYFVNLSVDLQNDIISRTSHTAIA